VQFVLVFSRVLVGLVLLVAGTAKLVQGRGQLRTAIAAYQIVPGSLAGVFATAVPIVEMAVGASLLTGLFMPIPALVASLLMAVFALAMGLNLLRGRRTPCACFGVSANHTVTWPRVIGDLALGGVAWVSSGELWPRSSWHWPFSLAPEGTTIEASDAVSAIVSALGMLMVFFLAKAVRSLKPVKERRSRLEEQVSSTDGKEGSEVPTKMPGESSQVWV
jgi:hypothetical protein